MRVVFMGTPALAAGALAGLYEAGYELPLVVTQPDRPGGRGRGVAFSPVKSFALEHGLQVYQPASLKNTDAAAHILAAKPELILVAAYGKLLPPALLEAAPLGCLNIHASLLPAYRGAAPIQWVLLNGEKETGVTIMKMDEGLDTGPILLQKKLAIPDDMDYQGLYDALSVLGARMMLEVLPLWSEGQLAPQEQPEEGVSYTERLTREDEIIHWTRPAQEIQNRIRAFSPSPGASARIGDKEIKVLRAIALTADEAAPLLDAPGAKALLDRTDIMPGTITGVLRREGPLVSAGKGYLLLKMIQQAGKKPIDAWAWLNGSRIGPGERFWEPPYQDELRP